MTLGQKIKTARKNKKITQSKLCGTKITRNMLSSIECDKATPSLETLKFLSNALELPIAYLLSSDDNLFAYQKYEKINEIKLLYKNCKYKKCVELITSINGMDDELAYILSTSYFHLGREAVFAGSLTSALKYLNSAKEYAKETIYDTKREEALTELFMAAAKNIKAPILELDHKDFEDRMAVLCDTETYRYIMQDKEYPYQNQLYLKHIAAKELMKNMKFFDALSLLTEIENLKSSKNYNAYLILSLYSDIENCHKRLGDFESAYKYSIKRERLMEAFNS